MATVSEVPGRGRALVAARHIRAGETVLAERPALLVVDEEHWERACAACLQPLQPEAHQRPPGEPGFCCPACHAAATQSAYWYPPHVCQALGGLDRRGLSSEDASSLRFLLHAKAAKAAALQGQGPPEQLAAARSFWQLLGGLCASGPAHPLARELHARLSAATGDGAGLSAEEVGQLLRQEACNSYGVMAPSGPQGERRVRGSGLWPLASLLNHECLPNCARFDGFDAATPAGPGVTPAGRPGPGDTSLAFRALHDLPAGTELTVSYFPLMTDWEERQQRCREVYGFACACPRCQGEAEWDAEDRSDDRMSDGGGEPATAAPADAGPSQREAGAAAAEGVVDAAYIQVFLLKYVCPREACGGTLAPLPGGQALQCSMCGAARTEAEFLQELESL